MRTKELAAMLQGNWEEEPEENDTPAELRLKTAMKKVVNALRLISELRHHGRPKATNDAMLDTTEPDAVTNETTQDDSKGLCSDLFSSQNVTRYLFCPLLWRNKWQNWANICTLGLSWHSLITISLKTMRHGEDAASRITDDEVLVQIVIVGLLWVRFFQYMKGTGLHFSTFVLMLEEISWNIRMFLVIFLMMIVMFAMLYHVLLVDADLDDDQWNFYASSTCKIFLSCPPFPVSGPLP